MKSTWRVPAAAGNRLAGAMNKLLTAEEIADYGEIMQWLTVVDNKKVAVLIGNLQARIVALEGVAKNLIKRNVVTIRDSSGNLLDEFIGVVRADHDALRAVLETPRLRRGHRGIGGGGGGG